MKNTREYLNALKAKFSATTDGQLIQHTGWHRQMISRYGRLLTTFDDDTAMKVATWLEIDPAQVIADMDAQRAARTRAAKVREEIARRVSTAAIVALVVLALPYLAPVLKHGDQAVDVFQAMYIMSNLTPAALTALSQAFLTILAAAFTLSYSPKRQ